MMARKRDDLLAHIRQVQDEAAEAEKVQHSVESREPVIDRLATEMREIRRQNHFTDLFVSTVGGARR